MMKVSLSTLATPPEIDTSLSRERYRYWVSDFLRMLNLGAVGC
jgi:hypothetical protein